MGNIFTTSVSGMNAAQLGMATTQHNISNASTPGYSRQQVLLTPATAQASGVGFIGQGVDVSSVKRIYDQYLTTQVLQQQTEASYLSTYHDAIAQIDSLLSNTTAGLSSAMQDFFSAVNGVANNPESVPARQTLLSNAQSVINRFQGIDQQLTDMANGITGQIDSSIKTINSYAQQIATLNGTIKEAIANEQGQPPNDLLDQRDQLINQLNQEIKTTILPQSDGTVNVFIGSGQSLVVNTRALALQAVQSASDPNKVDVDLQNGQNPIPLQQSSLQGGNLGAYLTFRDQSLEPARNALGRVALGLASSVNQQNQLGQDLNGALGGDLFNVATPRVNPGANNVGTAVVSATISDVSALTASDYQLKFDGTNYFLTRLSDNTLTNLGTTLPQTVDGVTINLASGAAAAGDSFLIRPTADAARDIALVTNDPTKIAAATPIRAKGALANLGTATISSGSVSNGTPGSPATPGNITFTASTFNFSPATSLVPGKSTPQAVASGVDFSVAGSAATAKVTTSAAFSVTADYTGAGAAAQFQISDDTVTNLTIDLSAQDWTGNEAGMAAEITNQLIAAGSNTVATYSGGALVFTSGETGSGAVQPTLSSVGADLNTDGLNTFVNSGGADAVATTNASLTIDGVSITLNGNDAAAQNIANELTTKMQASALGANYSAALNSSGNIVITHATSTSAVAITSVDANAAAAGFTNSSGVSGALASAGNPASLTIGGTAVILSANYLSFNQLAAAVQAQLGSNYSVTNNGGAITVARTTTGPASTAVNITAADANATAAGLGNATGTTGAAAVSATSTALPINANLRSPVSITFTSPTTFTVTGAVPAVIGLVTYTSGQDISYNGWTVQITGTPVAGDTFNITANTNATGDNRNALLMAGLQTQSLMENGTTSLEGAYSQLVGDVGTKAHELDITSQAQDSMVAQTVASQQAISGVNLDEEAANLLQYQRAYQASAKAMQIANTVFDALLAALNA